jgi:hypothetical protein
MLGDLATRANRRLPASTTDCQPIVSRRFGDFTGRATHCRAQLAALVGDDPNLPEPSSTALGQGAALPTGPLRAMARKHSSTLRRVSRILTPGDTFFGPLGGIHTTNGSADPNTLARALVHGCTQGRGRGDGG